MPTLSSKETGQFDHLDEVVSYAILKEQEAIDFYTDLAGRVKNASIAGELREIAAMEEQHRERLKRMDVGVESRTPARQVLDLKIGDYLVDREPTPEMSWQELLSIAMHREVAAMNLYLDLSKRVGDAGPRQLFENLAAEEASHKLYFERIWDDEILTEN